ncbi:fdrA domain protein [SAR202 cluster bacterium AD-804-J14_MRT_500m]|nr:fdrA domain protein [SAR202 cluster bacterium AD-804-J14_MRT_500m]
MLSKRLKIVNLGLSIFAESLEERGVSVVQVNWKPPAGGDLRLAEMIRRIRNINQSKLDDVDAS